MTGKIYRPEDKHPQPHQQDLAPDASKGLNYGTEGPPLKTRSAFDVKDLHKVLDDFSAHELKQVFVLLPGSRLETNATYLHISQEGERQEIHAEGSEDVSADGWMIPKKEVPYELWNRLLGHTEPERTKRSPGQPR